MGPKHLRGVLPLVVLVISTLPTPPAHAAGTVTVCDEANLRTALSGGGEVTFACSGTIILADRISITSDTTVDGSGQAVTISGNNAVQVFYVETGVTFGLKSLTIANANAKDNTTAGGGAVETWGGTIIIDNSNFTNNTAWSGGAIFSESGTVSVARSTFSNNTAFEQSAYGGAIFTESGTLTVSDSTFSGNGALTGGAIYSSDYAGTGMLTVSRSTFSNNTTSDWSGGAIVTSGAGDVSNSTFYGNRAPNEYGGAIANRGTLTVTNSTFSNNAADYGGAIYNYCGSNACGTVLLKNSIIASSTSGGNCRGTNITDGSGNLSYPDTSCPGINQNPYLGLLQDNGGPTWTMAPGSGSAAIDAGLDETCEAPPINNIDQRGVVRPQGEHCDIGAVEQNGVSLSRFWPIDIKLGSDRNPLNCRAENAVITVAILTSDTRDATTIDHTTVIFEGATETHVHKKTGEPTRHVKDVDGDGDTDLVLHFRLGDTALICDSTEAVLLGRTFEGEPIAGADYVWMVPSRK